MKCVDHIEMCKTKHTYTIKSKILCFITLLIYKPQVNYSKPWVPFTFK